MLTKVHISKVAISQLAIQPLIAQLLLAQIFHHGMFFLLKRVHRLLLYKQCNKLKKMSQGNENCSVCFSTMPPTATKKRYADGLAG